MSFLFIGCGGEGISGLGNISDSNPELTTEPVISEPIAMPEVGQINLAINNKVANQSSLLAEGVAERAIDGVYKMIQLPTFL